MNTSSFSPFITPLPMDPLPSVPLSYTAWGAADCAFWKPGEIEGRATFWKGKLAGSRRLWNAAAGTRSRSALPRRWVTFVRAEVANAARDLARQQGATLFSTLLAAFQVALSEWTGADDIVVGTPVANRGKQAVRESMGYCAGIVPLRGSVDRSRPFSESVRAVHETTVECFANAMPFVELAHALGEPNAAGYNPIFEVRFALQNHPVPDVALPTLSAKLSMRSTGTARFDLGCEITEQGEALEVVWLSRPEMFSAHEIEELNGIFQNFLAGVCRAAESRAA
jgi:non-ribosomal peptide synthetase component F